MSVVYTKIPILCKLWEHFSQIFSHETKPTRKRLFELFASILALNGFQSVRFNYQHFIKGISKRSLSSFYSTLRNSKIDLSNWLQGSVRAALSLLSPQVGQQPIVLSIDDTLIEKFGKKFEECGTLYDHAHHKGANYLNGHCFVSLLLSVPVRDPRLGKCYLSIPVAQRMWAKDGPSKLTIAAELVRSAMQEIGTQRDVILCCDSWYPKGGICDLPYEFPNLHLMCNTRKDTAVFDLPPEKQPGQIGAPKRYGEKLSLTDFELTEVPDTEYMVGARTVVTKLFGSKRHVHAIVTRTKNGESYRLFLCTADPAELGFDPDFLMSTTAKAYARAGVAILPLAIYSLRWGIEVCYNELKTFWSMGAYMVRSRKGMERLVNLLSASYALMVLLPWQLEEFASYRENSAQQNRFLIGTMISQQVFFEGFVSRLEKTENSSALAHSLIVQLRAMNLAA